MRTETFVRSLRRPLRLALLGVALTALAGCRQDMHDQKKYEPFEASPLFADGTSARVPPEHTVPRGSLARSDLYLTGLGQNELWTDVLPVTLDADLLARGEERFNIYCSPCHDRTGSGRGMIVQRGFFQPPSYHIDRLREMPIGYFYDVISNGFGQMSGYRAQVKPHDRWAIAAWIRVLQRSHNVPIASLSAEERANVEQGTDDRPSTDEGEEGEEEAH